MSWLSFILMTLLSCLVTTVLINWLFRRKYGPPPPRPARQRRVAAPAPEVDAPRPHDPMNVTQRNIALPPRGEAARELKAVAPEVGAMTMRASIRCPLHKKANVSWTCRYCKRDCCKHCITHVGAYKCCPRDACKESALRFSKAKRY